MRIQFSKVQSQYLPLTIYCKEQALVNQVKVLGAIISKDFKNFYGSLGAYSAKKCLI